MILSLLFAVATTMMAQVDYSPTNVSSATKTRSDRNMESVAVGETIYDLPASEQSQTYIDKYNDLTFTVKRGQNLQFDITTQGSWIHGVVYIDFDNNGFTAGVTESWKPTGDLVAYAFYNNGSNYDSSGWNSVGTVITGDGRNRPAIPSYTIPETVKPGEYRIRFKFDWCNIDPNGDADGRFNDFMTNGGQILDAKLVVEESRIFTVTYNYKQNGNLVGSVSHKVLEGESYPSLVSGLYGVTVNGSKPQGTVQANGEYDIDVTIGEMPFEYSSSYEKAVWYNLVMHSNHNTGNGTERYRTYVGAGNGTTLAWGEKKTLTNAYDDYYWAFVGDPINGFRVVNKSAEGKILSSNGTANPVLSQEEGLAEGYNTTWALAARKYNVNNRDGDFVHAGDWFCLKHANGQYMNANAGNGNVAFWSDNDNGSAILAVKPIEINAAADVATYFSETAIEKPTIEGVNVYYTTGNINNGYLGLVEITSDIISPETGIVIKYETEQNLTFAPHVVSPGSETVSGNLLKGTTKKTLISKDQNKEYYVLALKEGLGLGFYRAVNGENENEFYNGAFRAYLEMPAAQGQGTAAFFGFDWDNVTGLDNVVTEGTGAKVIYDLSGRRVKEITTSGLYIVNGKKVYVK